jgi:hypothetical protein
MVTNSRRRAGDGPGKCTGISANPHDLCGRDILIVPSVNSAHDAARRNNQPGNR